MKTDTLKNANFVPGRKPESALNKAQPRKENAASHSPFDGTRCKVELRNGEIVVLPFKRIKGQIHLNTGRGFLPLVATPMGNFYCGEITVKRAYPPDLDQCPTCKTDVCDHSTLTEVLTAYKQAKAHADKLAEQVRRLRKSIRHAHNCKAPQAFPCSCDADTLWNESATTLAAYESEAQ